jgi:hypothetical protein
MRGSFGDLSLLTIIDRSGQEGELTEIFYP